MHPDCSEVIPFMPEQIVNTDGTKKQDCEINASKRFIERLGRDFSQLKLIIGGDSMFSKQPIIETILQNKMHYLLTAKPGDHKYMMSWIDTCSNLHKIEFLDDKNRIHHYEWVNNVPLNGYGKTIHVNFFRCIIFDKNKHGEEKVVYKSSWVTDFVVEENNIKELVRVARCRWKSENECFNVMKNHGYCMEHSYGHGKNNMAFNFYLLTLLAFFMHQIFELTDRQYQACRSKLGSKKHLWETIRSYIKIIVFDSWELLLEFVLSPVAYKLIPVKNSS